MVKGLLRKEINKIHRFWLWPLTVIVGILLGSVIASTFLGSDPFYDIYYGTLYHLRRNKPLETAFATSDFSKVKELLARQPELVNARWEDGDTPLHRAVALTNFEEILTLLLNQGASINARDRHGETPLHTAIYEEDPEAESLLLSKGADWTLKDDRGFTALDWAVSRGYKELVDPLLAKSAKLNIYDAISLDDKEEVSKLLAADHKLINRPCASHSMPICVAAGYGFNDIVELLIQDGAKLNLKHQSPLISAAWDGHYETVKLLLDSGANVNARDYFQRTALYLAVGRIKTMRLLISRGADVDAADNRGETPLMRSIPFRQVFGFFDPGPRMATLKKTFVQLRPISPESEDSPSLGASMTLLLEHHANASVRDDSGRTALHYAAGVGTVEAAELLIKAGVDVKARDKAGETPLHTALKENNPEVAAVLRQHGAME